MSHFTNIKLEVKRRHQAEFVAALEEQFGKGKVLVSEEPVGLFGYQGDKRWLLAKTDQNYAPLCHIVVRRKDVGSSSNDLGFYWDENGKLVAVVSDFDRRSHFGQTKQDKVTQSYGVKVSTKTMKEEGYEVKATTNADGTVRLKCTIWS